MRITAPRTPFAKLLASINKVVETRNTIPILGHVRLVAEDGRLMVTGTDLDIEMSGSIETTVEAPGAICVDAKLLAGIVGKLAGSDVSMELADNNLTVSAGRSRFKLQTLPVDDFPTMAAGDLPVEFDADLAGLFAPVQFAISTEETRYYLNGIYIHVIDGKLRAVATDGHRLSRHEVDAPAGSEGMPGVIVPRKAVSVVPKGAVRVSMSETKIQFVADGVTITSKLIDGTFPDYQRVIPTGNDKVVTFAGGDMAKATDRVSIITSERGRAVKLSIAPGSITLAVNSPESGSATDEVAADYNGEPLDIGFNSAYLTELIGTLPAGDVTMTLADSGSPTLFSSATAEGLLCVLMPMRV